MTDTPSHVKLRIAMATAPILEEILQELQQQAQRGSPAPEVVEFLAGYSKASDGQYRPTLVRLATMALAALHLHDTQEEELAVALGLDEPGPPRRNCVPKEPEPFPRPFLPKKLPENLDLWRPPLPPTMPIQ